MRCCGSCEERSQLLTWELDAQPLSRMTSMYWSVQALSKLCSLPSDAGSV